jgi:hypothetical protein
MLIFVLAVVGAFGCKATPPSEPAPMRPASPLANEPYPSVEKTAAEGLATALAGTPEADPVGPKPLEVLVVSGGVEAAPFAAGVLVGWTEAGTRPTFDVVTGVSSGALIGACAFLGPKYDPKLRRLMLTMTSSDLVTIRPLRYLVRYRSLGSPAAAERLIQSEIDDAFLDDLRQAHAEGRHFFVGTTELETNQLVIWDVGAIASSGRPDADEMVRKVFLAAISWPGLVPPVEFDLESNGRLYHEQHYDGGATTMAFLRFGPLASWPQPDAPAQPGWLKGSNLYVLVCRKLYDDPAPMSKRPLPRVIEYMGLMLESLTRADISKIYSFCAASGMDFHLLSMPQEIPQEHLCFRAMFPTQAPQLFESGHRIGAGGPPWRLTPPGAEAGEEAVPRGDMPIRITR